MPDQSSNLTALRAGNASAAVYLSVYRGAEVFEATVDATPADQAMNLTVTAVDGSASNVKAGFRVDVYSSGGAYKGRTRLRYAGTISSTNLPIREHGQGVAQIVSGDTVRVYADVRLSDKVVTATAAFNPDDLAYSDQGSNPPPLACSGGAWAGFATMLPAAFTGSLSDWVDPDSNGPLTHAWTWPTGLTGSSMTDADPNVTTADAGEYLVTHVVTDADNSKTTTQYVPVIVHDAANPPYEVVVEDVSGDEENGHSFTVRPFGSLDLTSVPDGSFCILWMEQYLNGSVQAFGAKAPGRSHILGVGYIRREDGAFDSDTGVEELRFEVISPMARLAELVGYSKVMTSEASPDAWAEIKTLGTERAIRQLWQFYSNANEAGFDLVTDSDYVNYTYPQLFLQRSTPLAQMRELADGTDARLTCDRTGRFSLHTRPELLAVASRAAATKTITLTTSDIADWSYSREHWRPTELLEGRGFTNVNPQPIFSRAPGLAPGQGNQNSTVERLIASSQSDLNARTGRRYAAVDGIYVDANGALQMALDLELTLPTGYHVADFYDEYVAITLTTELRGLDLSDQLFVLRSVRLETGDDGTLQCAWTLRTATNGVAGVTYIPPTEEGNGLPPWTPPDFYVPPFPVLPPVDNPYGLGERGTQAVAVFWTDNTFTICGPNIAGSGAGFDVPEASGGPLWVTVDPTALAGWPGGTIVSFVVEPDSPSIIGTGAATHGWLITTTSRMRVVDIGLTPTLQYVGALTGSATVNRRIEIGRGNPDYIGVGSYLKSGGGVVFDYSDDRGVTWASETVRAFYDTLASNDWIPDIWFDPKVANRVIITAFLATGSTPTADGFISTTLPPSFAQISNPDVDPGSALAYTIASSYQSSILAHTRITYSMSTSIGTIQRVNGTTVTDVSPVVGSATFGTFIFPRAISLADNDRNFCVVIGLSEYGASGDVIVAYTRNFEGACDWTVIYGPVFYTSALWNGVYAISANAVYMLGSNALGFLDTTTGLIDNRIGNLSKPGVRAVGLCGISG